MHNNTERVKLPKHPYIPTISIMCSPQSTALANQDIRNKPYENFLRFCFCASGICFAYWYYGVVQEKLITHSGLGATFLLVMQSLANISLAMFWGQGMQSFCEDTSCSKSKSSLHHSLIRLTALVYVLSMVFANESLRFVTYPKAVLLKSCKLIPTMVMGRLVEGQRYSTSQWISAVFISAGISMFHLSRINSTQGSSERNGETDESWKGMILLTMSLCMDGFLGSFQGLLKREDKYGIRRPPTAVETMLWVNLYALVFLLPAAILSGQWKDGIDIMYNQDSTLIYSVLALNGVVAVGQVFIFLTLTWYSSLVCTTITTTRKFFTILFSVLYFGHRFSREQWVAVALVFGGLFLSIATRAKSEAKSGDGDVPLRSKKEN